MRSHRAGFQALGQDDGERRGRRLQRPPRVHRSCARSSVLASPSRRRGRRRDNRASPRPIPSRDAKAPRSGQRSSSSTARRAPAAERARARSAEPVPFAPRRARVKGRPRAPRPSWSGLRPCESKRAHGTGRRRGPRPSRHRPRPGRGPRAPPSGERTSPEDPKKDSGARTRGRSSSSRRGLTAMSLRPPTGSGREGDGREGWIS